MQFKDRQHQRRVNLNLMESEHIRQRQHLEDELKEDEATYEQNFQNFKEETNKKLVNLAEEMKRYQSIQKKKIAEKKEIIDEIEKGIESLKQMSKEQTNKE